MRGDRDDRMSIASSTVSREGSIGDDEEKILVSVRLRPLNEKEITRNDLSEWECINNTTVILKSDMPERSLYPSAYTFDRVFSPKSSTKQVYQEGAKEVALAALSGINSSIFAYGQTSSGKTYTMTGITQYALRDIYDYVNQHKEREFVLKFSAMEIYNEAVRDLLSSDCTPLRLMDDPERGTVVERLTEETLVDWNHLQELLSICEAQRKVGDTSMNETSSRSHQIIRLNFVDLAGSERASQSLSAGARLKEGSHINRSLLTLGTVIRKLSKGRNGHIPYRDSKLTRILHNALGGNAKTAIICTMSPARSYTEQSRNTLLFASCAKQVSTNAHVNVVMSDKALVKRLQKELVRLETQLRGVGSVPLSGDSTSLLKEKDLLIEQMNKEITELTRQLDLAQCRIDTLLNSTRAGRLRADDCSSSETSEVISLSHTDIGLPRINMLKSSDEPGTPDKQILQIPETPEDTFLLDGSTPKFFSDPHDWESKVHNEEPECIGKEVEHVHMDESITITKPEADGLSGGCEENSGTEAKDTDYTYDTLKQKIQELHKVIKYLEEAHDSAEAEAPPTPKEVGWTRSRSRRSVVLTIPSNLWFEKDEENENLPSTASDKDEKPEGSEQINAEVEHVLAARSLSTKGDSQPIKAEVEHDLAARSLSTNEDSQQIQAEPEHDRPPRCISRRHSKRDSQEIQVEPEHDLPVRSISRRHSKRDSQEIHVDPENELRVRSISRRHSKRDSQEFLSDIEEDLPVRSMPRKDSQEDFQQLQSELEQELPSMPRKDSDKDAQQIHDELELELPVISMSRKDSQKDSPKSHSRTSSEEELVKEIDIDVQDTASVIGLGAKSDKRTNLQQAGVSQVPEPSSRHEARKQKAQDVRQHWFVRFERYRKKIIELWARCNVPLVHRSYFFLLFKGDPSDNVYLEVELRRLYFLKDTSSRGSKSIIDGKFAAPNSSSKALNREREILAKQIQKKYNMKEREELYLKWGIDLSTKQRSLQLARRLWTDTKDMKHIKDSAVLCAKLGGFVEPKYAPKELFGLSFGTPMNLKPTTWKDNMSSLSLL
ncbi:hypothetical protein Tsubulata_017357 [Turnera subulata]|uniref:Kinesin motor domain-containing protein n=1 Tax=Turnera subulata TaxID=218843 RepID=A0A9Q0JML7_9ROSI|nr:hypothetical protein Tsubulata_017357 [Turnera subulata]